MYFRFDVNDLIRFTLTVRKNYRNVPYHNWDHAFSVAHAAFTVVKTARHKFSAYEVRRCENLSLSLSLCMEINTYLSNFYYSIIFCQMTLKVSFNANMPVSETVWQVFVEAIFRGYLYYINENLHHIMKKI